MYWYFKLILVNGNINALGTVRGLGVHFGRAVIGKIPVARLVDVICFGEEASKTSCSLALPGISAAESVRSCTFLHVYLSSRPTKSKTSYNASNRLGDPHILRRCVLRFHISDNTAVARSGNRISRN